MKKWFGKIRDLIDDFLYGRNGMDELGFASYLLGTCLFYFGVLLQNTYLLAAAALPYAYGFFRNFSRNTVCRRMENRKFTELLSRPKKYFHMLRLRRQDRHTHKYFMCRHCGQIIRVPAGEGKIEITCPKCRNKMVKKT